MACQFFKSTSFVCNIFLDHFDDELKINDVMEKEKEEEERSASLRQYIRHNPLLQYIRHNRLQSQERLFYDYFAKALVYAPKVFCTRFRMR